MNERTRLKGLGVDGRKILTFLLKKWAECGWIRLADDRDKLRALVNTVMNNVLGIL
jgi:hypothetical protein